MLNKENYVPWSSRLLRYAKSRPNGKLIHNSILNGPYVRKMIPEPGDANRDITITETFHLQTDDEFSDKELKQIEADDQAIKTILLSLPEDIYAAVDIVDCSKGRGMNPTPSRGQASTSGTQTDSAPVYDIDGSAEVHEKCDDNEIFNMFTQEEQYTKLLESIPESHQVLQNDNNVIFEDTSVEQGEETVEQHPVNFEETRALYESLYQNLAIKVEKVNLVNRKLKETNADLTTELARYKNEEKCLEISQKKYDKLERCYQQSVYQEQCLSKKINALHLSSGIQIMTLNEQISELNKQLSKEKSTVSFLLEEKKRMTIETHNWASSAHQELHKIVRDEIFPIVNQVEARLQNFEIQFLKEAAKFVGDFKSLTNEADASLAKHKALELEIERLLKAVVSQDIMIILQNESVVDITDLQTELERTKERFENCIIKKETEYAKLSNDWYKKYDE
nr:hypothetical protein [Tanacetum cinerariifolium]